MKACSPQPGAIKAEDQYFIQEIEVWITRQGRGVVEDRHVRTEEDHVYYKITGREKRYVIRHYVQSRQEPKALYERPLANEAYFASSVVHTTRHYIRELDNTFFKYYDDADEVLENIKSFIQWLRKIPTLKNKKQMKEIKEKNEYLLKDRPVFPEMELIRQSQVGLKVKRRSDLKGLARHNQDALDLGDSIL